MASSDAPPTDVLEAFGLTGIPQRMQGGQNSSWIVSGTILKPWESLALDHVEWQSGIQAQLHDHQHRTAECQFRVAQPLEAKNQIPGHSSYVVDGWTATRFIEGVEDLDLEARLRVILSASRAMHAVLKDIVPEPHPSVLQRTDRWAYAELIAWDELIFAETPNTSSEMFDRLSPYIRHLERLKRPLAHNQVVRQLIHGDLSGNILFAPTESNSTYVPGIIDFTPQWRPVEFAEAIIVADALTWQGCGKDFVEVVGFTELRFQMLVRALLFRVLTYTIDINEEFVRQNLGNMNISHAMKVVDECHEQLKTSGAV